MSEKFILEQRFCMGSGDINVVGEMLGLDWNRVCDLISSAELYGQDGNGYISVERGYYDFNSELNKIFDKIFEDNPGVAEIYILDSH